MVKTVYLKLYCLQLVRQVVAIDFIKSVSGGVLYVTQEDIF